MMGAAGATFLSYTFLAVLTLFVSGRVFKIRYEYFRLAKMYLTALLIFSVSRFLDFDSVAVSIAAKTSLVLLFPFILVPLRFYDEKEKRKIGEFYRAGIQRIRGPKEDSQTTE
jgi:hypothetical protein